MKIADQYTLNGPRDKVWSLIYDPTALIALIPGCEQLDQISPDEYRGQMQVRIPAVAGVYKSYVKIVEREAPRFARFEGEVEGAAGAIKGSAFFTLEAINPQQTMLAYEGQAMITGALARLNSRFVEGIAKTLINQGLAQLDRQVQASLARAEPAPPAPFLLRLVRHIRRLLRLGPASPLY